MTSEPIASYWSRACADLGLPADTPVPEAWRFGDAPELADRLLALVLEGTKTATTGALWEHEAENEPVPEAGELSIVLDGAGRPACVIELTEVRVLPMSDVDAQFAYDEGEGDPTLASWRDAHETFFRRHLHRIDREFAPDMPLVLQRFLVRHTAGER